MFKTRLLTNEEQDGARLLQDAMEYLRHHRWFDIITRVDFIMGDCKQLQESIDTQQTLLILISVYQENFCERS